MAEYNENSNMLWDTGKFLYQWEALKMLQKAPVEGYYEPFSRFLGGRVDQMIVGKKGQRTVLSGGIRLGKPIDPRWSGALKKAGPKKIVRGIKNKGLSLTSRKAMGKVLLGKAAGMALKGISLMYAYDMFVGLPTMAWKAATSAVRKTRGLEMGGYFPETQGSLTSRQRTVQAISDSRLQARSAVGNEAMLMHR